SVIHTFGSGDQELTITDPNTGNNQGEVEIAVNEEVVIESTKVKEGVFQDEELAELYVNYSQPSFRDSLPEVAETIDLYLNKGDYTTDLDHHIGTYSDPMSLYSNVSGFGSRKYKPAALKVRPIKAELPEEFRVRRHIFGDPLKELPDLPTHPPEFTLGVRYTQERKWIIDKDHPEGFLTNEERKLVHHLMKVQEMGFAWDQSEGGTFREDFFPPVKILVIPHKPWVEKKIPVPPEIFSKEFMNHQVQATDLNGSVW
ncbi:hypothetical protein EV360DRAFT_77048, partial [Lentinula raphanica]